MQPTKTTTKRKRDVDGEDDIIRNRRRSKRLQQLAPGPNQASPQTKWSESNRKPAYPQPPLQSIAAEASESKVVLTKEDFIKDWLRSSQPPSQELLVGDPESSLSPDMSRKQAPASLDLGTSTSKRSEKSTASAHDLDYRKSLRLRNIFIGEDDVPGALLQRANRIVNRSRASPEMDDKAVQEIKNKSSHLETGVELTIIQQLAPSIIRAMSKLDSHTLAVMPDQLWSNCVPIPLAPSILNNPLPLPKPKPDLTFGYSQTAFNPEQAAVIELLVDDQLGRSYASPDQTLCFPFLTVEFKSQAEGGTLFMGTNQAVGAGAIALNGTLDLFERSSGLKSFDFDEPQFFSLSPWITRRLGSMCTGFHVQKLSRHLLDDDQGIRALVRAIKNILDYGADMRLQALCKALDTYREGIMRGRKEAAAIAAKDRPLNGTRSKKTAIDTPPLSSLSSSSSSSSSAAAAVATAATAAKLDQKPQLKQSGAAVPDGSKVSRGHQHTHVKPIKPRTRPSTSARSTRNITSTKREAEKANGSQARNTRSSDRARRADLDTEMEGRAYKKR